MLTLDYIRKPNPRFESTKEIASSWRIQHKQACIHPTHTERPMRDLISAWIAYANVHQAMYGSEVGTDCVLGPEWSKVGMALRTLLNGDIGRLDGGTLDTILYTNLKEQGFDPDKD